MYNPTKMLVVVDYQNDFVDGALGFAGAEQLDPAIAGLIRAYADEGQVVIATMDTHEAPEEYLASVEGRHLPVPHCEKYTSGWELFGETGELLNAMYENVNDPEVNFRRIEKEKFAVAPKDMTVLRNDFASIMSIELVGLVSNICVIANAIAFQAAFPNAEITVNSDLTLSFDAKLDAETMDVLRGLQVNIIGERAGRP